MNIYLIVEDGESFCIRAQSMAVAVLVCEKAYLEACQEGEENPIEVFAEKEHYHTEIL